VYTAYQVSLYPSLTLGDTVTSSEEVEFTRIIDGLLAVADLNTVTRKKIREGLESALGRDLSSQKVSALHVVVLLYRHTFRVRGLLL
jgi:hypothetical protein